MDYNLLKKKKKKHMDYNRRFEFYKVYDSCIHFQITKRS